MTEQQFAEHLKGQGIDARSMKSRLRAQSVWRDVIRRKFGPHGVGDRARGRQGRRVVGSAAGEDQTELQLQKITLSTPGKIDQKVMASGSRKPRPCGASSAAARACRPSPSAAAGRQLRGHGLQAGRHGVAEPTRSLLLSAKDGEMVPGNLAQSGVELYAVCGRRTVKADEQKRQQVQEELTQKEFDVLARRHLRDLRQDAMIEYK